MTLKEKTKESAGMQFVVESMDIMTTAGRRMLLNQPMPTEADDIEQELERVSRIIAATQTATHKEANQRLRHSVMELHDIQGSIESLRSQVILDEVELFEIKKLAYLCRNARNASKEMGIDDVLQIPDLEAVFTLLDPDKTNIAHFYIYDSYDAELPQLRRELRALRQNDSEEHQQRIGELTAKQNEIQLKVATQLSDHLRVYREHLAEGLSRIARTDILLAKAQLAVSWHLVRPSIRSHSLELEGLFNPRLKELNNNIGTRYQDIDIDLNEGVCFITGANMSGKTVLLKSIGIAQMMFQWGMYVPAQRASMSPVDDVVLCIGDDQNEMKGLSSYASEMIKISNTLNRSQSERLLILIDEPARTTNPTEGKAIVQALGTLLNTRDSISMITTHYSNLKLECRRMRVRGFMESLCNGKEINPQNINQFMDYSLMEDTSEEVPHEALRIAEILGCDSDLIAYAQTYLLEEEKEMRALNRDQ